MKLRENLKMYLMRIKLKKMKKYLQNIIKSLLKRLYRCQNQLEAANNKINVLEINIEEINKKGELIIDSMDTSSRKEKRLLENRINIRKRFRK